MAGSVRQSSRRPRMMRMMTKISSATICGLALLMSAVTLSASQAPAKTATQFYMEYRVAFDKATKIEDVLPFMAAANRKQVESTPAAQRPEMFGMIKMMGTYTNLKVTKEVKTAKGATLTAEAIDADKTKQ